LPADQRELVDWLNKQLGQKQTEIASMPWLFGVSALSSATPATKEHAKIQNLRSDLRNGVRLIDLLEVPSKK